ncbi:MAG: hypothetical protein C4522_08345 [Desulfobacteraceae bacterium]|nr:MAG: hypothetical protein C4522_08345 [Desulfobacteraceae bacterium]
MVKKTLFISIVLFLVYNLLLHYIDFPVKPGHQWQENLIKAEDYVYIKNKSKSVIVGSSLSALLVDDLLPKSSFNLSFAGHSAFDGLEIIKRTGSSPEVVYIETNFIFRQADKGLLNRVFMPVRYSLKKIFPALMEKNQPVCLFNSVIFWMLSNLKKNLIPAKIDEVISKQPVREDTKKLLLDILIKDYSSPPDQAIVKKNKYKLKKYKDYLEKKGSRVILFEMPIDERLINLNLFVRARKTIEDVFSPDKYATIQSPDIKKYNTTDGLHLDRQSVMSYTTFLSSEIKRHSTHKKI